MTAQLSREQLKTRIDRAMKEFTEGRASMHVPPLDTDVDMVLADCLTLLAGMDREPVAKVDKIGVCWYADDGVSRKPAVGEELYAAPPVPVAVPDELTFEKIAEITASQGYEYSINECICAASWWNACRAAMLKAGPVTRWIKCSERMPELGVDVLACNVSPIGGYQEIETAQWHGGMKGNQPVFITSADTIEPELWMPLPVALEQE